MTDPKDIGIIIPKILLPRKGIDLSKWAVVACDQYTSQPDYWNNVARYISNSPSTLHITLPEIYLEDKDMDKRIKGINSNMKKYYDEGILIEEKEGFIYVDRKTSHAKSRKGLIVALDLEKYDYNKGSQTLIRATEGTVLERLPPRIKIRENAPIELPHIMVLIDDPKMAVIDPLSKKLSKLRKLYDFDLMQGSGHIKGYKLEDKRMISQTINALGKLADPKTFQKKYAVDAKKKVLLFAVGDGNHSLATAKAIWEKKKKTLPKKELADNPARYALVELVNVHDAGLKFEPIHRVVFNIDDDIFAKMREFYSKEKSTFEHKRFSSRTEMQLALKEAQKNAKDKKTHHITYIKGNEYGIISVGNPKYNLEVGTLQSFLDQYLAIKKDSKIDYIHGQDVVENLGSKEGNIGFYLPVMEKTELFRTVIVDGVLPRKTFSMGEADEKRFYLEARKII